MYGIDSIDHVVGFPPSEGIPPMNVAARKARTRLAHVFAAALVVLVVPSLAFGQTQPGVIINPLSQFPITVDGQFTDGVSPEGVVQGEWSDVTPQAFISPPTNSGQLVLSSLGDPAVNSLLYAAVAPGVSQESAELYLMYVYSPRTNQSFAEGEFIADIRFPFNIGNINPAAVPGESNITVQFRGAAAGAESFFDVFVDIDGDNQGDFTAEQLGMEGAAGFGPSPLGQFDHLLVELEVPLFLPEGFGDGNPFPPEGTPPDAGGYSPDPKFWGADIANDAVDPPASGGIFTINPDGSTIIDSSQFLPTSAVPEPSTIALASFGVFALGLLKLRRRRAV